MKSPLGLMPEHIWNEKNPYPKPSDIAARIESLEAALYRYYEVDKKCPLEWLDELTQRRNQLETWK